MRKQLFVELKIPARGLHPSLGSVIEFDSWFPTEKDALSFREDDYTISVFCNRDSILNLPLDQDGNVDEDGLTKPRNFLTNELVFLISIENISNDLANFIADVDVREDFTGNDFGKEYRQLGIKINTSVISIYNQLITYFRAEKNQYWLLERDDLPSDDVFEGRAKFDEGSWFRWRPTHVKTLVAIVGNTEDLISKRDWYEVKDNPSRIKQIWSPSLLLAEARLLFQLGYKRSALIEACAALEIAIERFMTNPRLKGLLDIEQIRGINLANLLQKKNEVGIRVVINLWLPIIFPRDILSNETIQAVQNAVEDRNKVAHKGMRKIDDKKLYDYLKHIDCFCKILRSYTAKINRSKNKG